jgi:hypothetical protein
MCAISAQSQTKINGKRKGPGWFPEPRYVAVIPACGMCVSLSMASSPIHSARHTRA